MDVITQRLFDTAKKIRSLLPKIQVDIQTLTSQVEAIREDYHSNQSQRQAPLVIHAELNRSQQEIEHDAERERRDQKRLRMESCGLIVATIVAITNFLIFGTYVGLWIETRHATHIAAISADAAQKSAGASEAQAKSAQAQTEVARRSA